MFSNVSVGGWVEKVGETMPRGPTTEGFQAMGIKKRPQATSQQLRSRVENLQEQLQNSRRRGRKILNAILPAQELEEEGSHDRILPQPHLTKKERISRRHISQIFSKIDQLLNGSNNLHEEEKGEGRKEGKVRGGAAGLNPSLAPPQVAERGCKGCTLGWRGAAVCFRVSSPLHCQLGCSQRDLIWKPPFFYWLHTFKLATHLQIGPTHLITGRPLYSTLQCPAKQLISSATI